MLGRAWRRPAPAWCSRRIHGGSRSPVGLPAARSTPVDEVGAGVAPATAAIDAYAAGGTTSSESANAEYSPLTCRSPSLRAAPRPWLSVCTTRTRRVVGRRTVGDRAGPVGRAVVDHHDLEVDALLGEQAVEAVGQVGRHVVDRHDDADQRSGAPLCPTESATPGGCHAARSVTAVSSSPTVTQTRSVTDIRAEDYPRKVLFVAGAGRSGTSTLAGLMQILGLHVPQPEVAADATNPKGFGEPRWVVDHHDRLLKEAVVQVSDARPEAWFETGRIATREPERITTADWLDGHFAEGQRAGGQGPAAELVPRCGGSPRSRRRDAGLRDHAAAAGRGRRQQADLLRQQARRRPPRRVLAQHAAAHRARHARVDGGADGGARSSCGTPTCSTTGPRPSMRVGETLQLQHVLHANSEEIRDGHRFVDPSPAPDDRRASTTSTCRRSCTS